MKATYELGIEEAWKPGASGRTRTFRTFEGSLKALREYENHPSRTKPVVLQRAYSRGAEKGRKAGTVRTTIWTRSKGWIRENLEVHEEDAIKERK